MTQQQKTKQKTITTIKQYKWQWYKNSSGNTERMIILNKC